MALTNPERQASWCERHLKNDNGTKLPRSVHFRRQQRGADQAKRLSRGLLGTVSQQEWPSADCRITHQLSGKALKQYFVGEETTRHQ
jgi:hypothetical protein